MTSCNDIAYNACNGNSDDPNNPTFVWAKDNNGCCYIVDPQSFADGWSSDDAFPSASLCLSGNSTPVDTSQGNPCNRSNVINNGGKDPGVDNSCYSACSSQSQKAVWNGSPRATSR